MVPLSVNMERSNPSFHLNAVHNLFLSFKSGFLSWELGMYAVMMAK